MQEFIKNKVVIYFSIFGAGFAFLLSIFSGSSFVEILIRTILGFILMGVLGLGLIFFLKQSLSEEDYNNLFQVSINHSPAGDQFKQNKIDLTEDSDVSSENGYDHIYKENNVKETVEEIPDNPEFKTAAGRFGGTVKEDYEKSLQSNDPVKSMQKDFNPVVNTVREDASGGSPIAYEENIVKEDENIDMKDDLGRLKEAKHEEKLKNAIKPGMEGSVKFKAGNKNVTVDPKVIAQAIKTVLSKD